MKRVLHLIETAGPGGAERVLLSLVDRVDQSRFEPLVCLLREGWLSDQVRSRGLDPIILPLGRTPDVGWLRRLMRVIRARDVALLHAHEFAMNTYAALASALTGVPAVATVHGKNYYGDRLRRRLAYRFVARQAQLVAVSADIAEFLHSRVGISPASIRTIPNGIDTGRYDRGEEDRTETRRALGLAERTPVVLCVGNLYPVKGHAYALEAVALLRRRNYSVHLLLAGRGQLQADLERQAIALGIRDHVSFLGFVDDVTRLLLAADVFVLPSLSEGLPLSVLEAMASRRPVVATAVGGIGEVIHDGREGLLVPPGSPEALAEAMRRLLDDDAFGRRLAAQARKRVEDAFGLRTTLTAYEELYTRCLNGARSLVVNETQPDSDRRTPRAYGSK